MSEPTVRYQLDGAVCTMTLHRPEVYNAFNEAMTTELLKAFKQAAKDDAVRAVIVTGAGKAFSSGQDLKDLESQYSGEARPVLGPRLRQGYNPVILAMRQLEKPVIAAVNGVAAGAGCSLALAADLRILSDAASLIEVFVHVGLVPDSGSTFMLPRLIGLAKSLELCFTGDKVAADEALRLGLAHRVVPADALMDEARKLAERLAALPTRAIGLTKRLLNQAFEHSLEQQLELEAFAQEAAGKTRDHIEGVRAFIEKRKPQFTGQ